MDNKEGIQLTEDEVFYTLAVMSGYIRDVEKNVSEAKKIIADKDGYVKHSVEEAQKIVDGAESILPIVKSAHEKLMTRAVVINWKREIAKGMGEVFGWDTSAKST